MYCARVHWERLVSGVIERLGSPLRDPPDAPPWVLRCGRPSDYPWRGLIRRATKISVGKWTSSLLPYSKVDRSCSNALLSNNRIPGEGCPLGWSVQVFGVRAAGSHQREWAECGARGSARDVTDTTRRDQERTLGCVLSVSSAKHDCAYYGLGHYRAESGMLCTV